MRKLWRVWNQHTTSNWKLFRKIWTQRGRNEKARRPIKDGPILKKNPHKWKIKPSAINLNWLVIPYNWLDFFIFIFMSKRKSLHINSNSAHLSKKKVITRTLLSVMLVVKTILEKNHSHHCCIPDHCSEIWHFFSYSQISSWLKDVFFGWKYDKHRLMQKVFVSVL